jgi:hypothetical protein
VKHWLARLLLGALVTLIGIGGCSAPVSRQPEPISRTSQAVTGP